MRRVLLALVPGLAVMAFGAACSEDAPAPPPTAPTAVTPASSTPPATPGPAATPSPTPTPTPVIEYRFPISPISAAGFDQRVNGHDHPATDVFAEEGTDIVAVTSGVIAFVNRVDRWDSQVDDGATRGGLYLAIHGDDGMQYYYSHFLDVRDDLEPGTRVAAGEVIGHVGRSGNAAPTPPHLHFGISCPTEPDDWQVRRGQFLPLPFLVPWFTGALAPSPAEAHGAACA